MWHLIARVVCEFNYGSCVRVAGANVFIDFPTSWKQAMRSTSHLTLEYQMS